MKYKKFSYKRVEDLCLDIWFTISAIESSIENSKDNHKDCLFSYQRKLDESVSEINSLI